jgi:hypothetical protein
MTMNRYFVLIFLSIVSPVLALAGDSQFTVGGQLGLPAGLNLNLGYGYNSYRLNIIGFYVGDYSNSVMNSGFQFEMSKFLSQGKVSHRLSIMAGQSLIGNNTSSPLNYLGLGYAVGWENIYMQPGVAMQSFGSEYGSFKKFFPFFNIGFSACRIVL